MLKNFYISADNGYKIVCNCKLFKITGSIFNKNVYEFRLFKVLITIAIAVAMVAYI